jgi:hypothetical protein
MVSLNVGVSLIRAHHFIETPRSNDPSCVDESVQESCLHLDGIPQLVVYVFVCAETHQQTCFRLS